jgi:PPOX class probable F420-dependent enzyme
VGGVRREGFLEMDLSEKQFEFVSRLEFCKFASINRDGSPHVTPTWFLLEGGRGKGDNKLIITTAENTVKVQNVRRDPKVSVLIDDKLSYVTLVGRAMIDGDRDANEDTRRMAVKSLGETAAKDILPGILKVKHVSIVVTPEKVMSYNV